MSLRRAPPAGGATKQPSGFSGLLRRARNDILLRIVTTFFLVTIFLLPTISSAQANIVDAVVGTNTATNAFEKAVGGKFINLGVFVAKIIGVIMGFLGIIFVVLMTYAGFLWMTAGGEEDNVKKAQKILRQSILGAIVTLSAWTISHFVLNAILESLKK